MDPTNPTSSRDDYLRNKNSQYNSKVAGLLYGGSERPITPQHIGKKILPHPGQTNVPAPFATFESAVEAPAPKGSIQGGQMHKTYQARHKTKEGAGKIGGVEFDSEVYRQQLEANAANRTAQKARNWGSANLLGGHPATPQGNPEMDENFQDDINGPIY